MPGRRIIWRFGVVIPLLASAILTAQAIPADAAVAAPIDSVYGWQYTNALVKKGVTYTVTTDDTGPDGQAGTWTVDYRNFPSVGPSGYDRSTDAKIYQGCKYEPSMPYGRLLGRIGDDGKVFSIGTGRTFTADASGPLNARINDQDHCLVDNQGYIMVWTKGSDEP
jgi:eukaryotic-like serine/threonine-protein kinase